MNKSRFISLIIAVICVLAAVILELSSGTGGASQASGGRRLSLWMIFLMMNFLALAFIWFGDEIGGFTGMTGRGAITATTPGCMVRAVGWIILIVSIGLLISEIRLIL